MTESNDYELGRQAWLDGAPMPLMPLDEATDAEHLFFLGYLRERVRDCYFQVEALLYPGRVEPRP